MPFQGVSAMERRRLFVETAQMEGSNVRELCRGFGISPTTGYKWLDRARASGPGELEERSRRSHHTPTRDDARASPSAVTSSIAACFASRPPRLSPMHAGHPIQQSQRRARSAAAA